MISYHHEFTDTAITNLRGKHYTPFVDPKLVVDGSKIPADDSITYKNSINAARLIPPSLNLYLDAQSTSSEGSMTLRIVNVDSTMVFDSVFAMVAVCQDSVDGIVKDFNYVCRSMHYFPISIAYADSIDTTITFTHSYPVAKLHAVAFIQNLKNGSLDYLKVYQAVAVPFANVQE